MFGNDRTGPSAEDINKHNQIGSEAYLHQAYNQEILDDATVIKICKRMRFSVKQVLAHIASDIDSLPYLQRIVLDTETELSRYGRDENQGSNAEDLGILKRIKYILIGDLSLGKRAQSKRIRGLKKALARWYPPDYIVVDTLLADEEWYLNIECLQRRKDAKRMLRVYFKQRNRMVESNLRLVFAVAARYKHFGVPYEDLVQEGNLGLIKAIERFDCDKGYKFSTYAYRVISQSVHLAVDKSRGIVRRPFRMMRDAQVVAEARTKIEQQSGRSARVAHVIESLGESVEFLEHILDGQIERTASIDAFDEPVVVDTLEDDAGTCPESNTTQKSNFAYLSQEMQHFNERDRQIVLMKCGVGVRKDYTFEEIGEQFSLSRERVRQIYNKCVDHIRERLEDDKLFWEEPPIN